MSLDLEPIKALCESGDFLGHASTAVPALVAEVERLRAELAEATRPLYMAAPSRTIGGGW